MTDELFDAVEAGDAEKVRRLLDAGADVHAKAPDRFTKSGPELARPYVTPLHQAAERGYPEMVELLLDHGADVDAHNGYGNTALFNAVWYDDTDMARLLIDHGADPNAKNSAGTTLLAKAQQNGNDEMVALLSG